MKKYSGCARKGTCAGRGIYTRVRIGAFSAFGARKNVTRSYKLQEDRCRSRSTKCCDTRARHGDRSDSRRRTGGWNSITVISPARSRPAGSDLGGKFFCRKTVDLALSGTLRIKLVQVPLAFLAFAVSHDRNGRGLKTAPDTARRGAPPYGRSIRLLGDVRETSVAEAEIIEPDHSREDKNSLAAWLNRCGRYCRSAGLNRLWPQRGVPPANAPGPYEATLPKVGDVERAETL
jgi:hypothetical protein